MTAKNSKKLFLVSLLCACSVLIAAPLAFSQQSSGVIAQGFQGNSAKGTIVAGALVSTTADTSDTVELSTAETSTRLAGVVDEHPFISISTANKEVQVVSNGMTSVLVSDINGSIEVGDKITASPIAGVGMLATVNSQVVGTAQASFNSSKGQVRTVTDKSGASRTVHIGSMPLQVSVAYYQVPSSSFLPPFIQNLANSVAGRPVSLLRIILCGFLMLFGFIYIGILVYASVRSAVVALGRNPLAAHDIRRSLIQMGIISVVILGATLLAAYLILAV